MAKTIGVQFAIGAAMSTTVASAFATVDSKVKSLKTNVKELNAVSERASRLMTADARLQTARAAHSASPTEKTTTELRTAERALKSAQRAADKYNISVAESAKVHARAQAALKTTQAALERQEKFQFNAAKRQELQGQMLGTVASFAAVTVPIKLAIDFESAFADVRKVVDFANEAEAQGAQRDIRALAEETGLSAQGIAQIYASAGEAGLAKNREELREFADTAAKMAVAYGISAEEAGDKMASWRAKMGLSHQEVIALADSMNHLGNNMAATAKDTATVVERMGAVAKGAGLSAKSISALGATFVAASPNPEMAATGMKNFLLALTKGDQMTSAQKEMMKKLGINPKELANAMQKDAEGTIVAVMGALSRLPQAQQGGALSALFGSESIGAIQPLLTNTKMLKDAFALVADEQQYAGSMQTEYETRSKTTEHALNQLKRTAESLGIALGSAVLPGITAVAKGLATMVQPVVFLADTFPGVTTVVFGTVAALVTLKLATLGGAYAATIISDGWTIAKSVVTALRPAVLRQTVAMKAQRVTSLALAAGTKIMTVAQWALNAAMTANPIGITVVAVAALAAGMVWLYRNCEPVRTAIDAVWSVIKTVGKNVLKVLFLPMAIAWNAIKAAWEPAKAFFSGLWTGIKTTAVAVWDTVAGAALTVVNAITAYFSPMTSVFGAVWEGVKAPAVAVFDWMNAKFEWVAGKFEWLSKGWKTVSGWFGDDEKAPSVAPEQKAVAAQGTVAAQTATPSVTATASSPSARASTPQAAATPSANAASSAAGRSAAAPAPAPRPNAQTPGITVQPSISFSIAMDGVSSKDVGELLVKAVKSHEPALVSFFTKLLERIIADQRRLAYDS